MIARIIIDPSVMPKAGSQLVGAGLAVVWRRFNVTSNRPRGAAPVCCFKADVV
jgi:hypothetical protein